VIAAHDLYCCLLPQCEALHTCRSGFPIVTKWCCGNSRFLRESAKIFPRVSKMMKFHLCTPRPTLDRARYVTFCSLSLTGRFVLFQNASELNLITFCFMTVTVILMALAVYGTFCKLCHAFV